MKKNIIIAITISSLLIIFSLIMTNNQSKNIIAKEEILINNVSIIDGTQIIEIKAKGGYTPKESIAKAGIPTIIRFNTNGTFDCSSSVRIPSMNIFKNLKPSGTTDIDLGTQKTGKIPGSCGMGMYPFKIEFK